MRGATDETGLAFALGVMTNLNTSKTGRYWFFNNQNGANLTNALVVQEKNDGTWGKKYAYIHTGSDPVDTNNALLSWSLGAGKPLASGVDLNEVYTVGNYKCSTDAEAEKCANCPTTSAFVMKVYSPTGNSTIGAPTEGKWLYGMQEIHTLSNTHWYRRFANSGNSTYSFSDWKQIVTASESGAISDYTIKGAVYN